MACGKKGCGCGTMKKTAKKAAKKKTAKKK
jgi:hypothetical protein